MTLLFLPEFVAFALMAWLIGGEAVGVEWRDGAKPKIRRVK